MTALGIVDWGRSPSRGRLVRGGEFTGAGLAILLGAVGAGVGLGMWSSDAADRDLAIHLLADGSSVTARVVDVGSSRSTTWVDIEVTDLSGRTVQTTLRGVLDENATNDTYRPSDRADPMALPALADPDDPSVVMARDDAQYRAAESDSTSQVMTGISLVVLVVGLAIAFGTTKRRRAAGGH